MGLWQTSLSFKENSPFVHPEQDAPFNRKNHDLLEEHFGSGQEPRDFPSKNVDDYIKVNQTGEHVNENGIHPDDGQRKRPFPISADVNNPIKNQKHEARTTSRHKAVRSRPHLHDHWHNKACSITNRQAPKSYTADERGLSFLRPRAHE
jgi:hypothetical protein